MSSVRYYVNTLTMVNIFKHVLDTLSEIHAFAS